MNYIEIYIELKKQDRSLTEERFSTDYLGMSSHYVSMCKSRKVGISAAALLQLLSNLRRLSKLWQQIEDTNEARLSIRARTKARHFNGLAEFVLLQVLHQQPHSTGCGLKKSTI